MNNDEIAVTFTAVFSSPGGAKVLEHLEKHFKENTENCDAELLRYTAGQRSVIKFINKLISKGRGDE